MRAVDVQCFAGGLTLGVVQAGWDLVGKREAPAGFGVAQCEANRHLLPGDWVSQASDPSEWEPVEAEAVFSNPPCSGFSGLSKPDYTGVDAGINSCMWDTFAYAAKVRPRTVVMESVQGAFKKGLPLMRALRQQLADDTGERWLMYHVLQDNYSLGGCSRRPRYFLVVSREPFGVEPHPLTRLPTLNDAIGDLEPLSLTYEPQPYRGVPSWWSAPLRRADGLVDGHSLPRSTATDRWRDLLELVELGPGGHATTALREAVRRHGHDGLPASWRDWRRQDGRLWLDHLRELDYDLGVFQPKRWDGDKPARVVVGGSTRLSFHPHLPRPLTNRECARVMGFPDAWLARPLLGNPTLDAGWGKGVSVTAGRWVARWALESLHGRPGALEGRPVSRVLPGYDDEPDELVLSVSDDWKMFTKGESRGKLAA